MSVIRMPVGCSYQSFEVQCAVCQNVSTVEAKWGGEEILRLQVAPCKRCLEKAEQDAVDLYVQTEREAKR